MAIYRGPGGSGDAVNDSSSETRLAVEARDAALAAQAAAEAAQAAAETAETNAQTAETNAETAETNAETAATNAASSASSASSSASAASTSATSAASSASSASTSATNAASSASSASTSASNASTSATNAASSATTASTAATNAASSASSASTSASTATTKASEASTSATNAASSASSASSSASTATTQAGIATTKASEASTSATNAASSASSASTSATNAASSASSASTSATNAASSATAASSAQSAAEAARDAALSAYDNFDDRYLGPKASDPTLDNDGNALLSGALYFNTTTNVMKVYTGSSWVAAYVSAAGVLLAVNNLSDLNSVSTARTNLGVTATGSDTTYAYRANNLSDLANAATARTNLGLGTAATTAATDYATAAQGAKADTALQPAAIGVSVQGYDADLGAIAAIAGTSGLLKKTAANTWSLDTTSYLSGTVGVANGGTGLTSLTAGYIPYGNGTSAFSSSSALSFNGTTLRVNAANSSYIALVNGTTKGVRIGADTIGGILEGVDSTGSATYQPLFVGGSDLRVLISGAEKMRIDSSGNVGIGRSTASFKLDVAEPYTSGDVYAGLRLSSNNYGYIIKGGIKSGVGGVLTFSYDNAGASAEVMRLDTTGNVGIGTSSPSYKLDVKDNSRLSGSNAYFDVVNYGGTCTVRMQSADTNYGIFGTTTNHKLTFRTNNTEQMVLDTSGNLGLGVTPTAGTGDIRHIEVPAGGIFRSQGTNVDLGTNYYYNSGYTYISSTTATRFEQNGGAFRWYNAPSGTAGTAISFTQAMTLSASGNLGIGSSSTSPAVPLDVTGSAYLRSGGSSVSLQFGPTVGTGDAGIYYDVSGSFSVNSRTSYPLLLSALGSTYTAFNTNGSERMRIDSSGNVGIGTTTPSYKLEVNGTLGVNGQITGNANNAFLNTARGVNATYAIIGNTGGNTFIGRDDSTGSIITGAAYSSFLWSTGAYPLLFATNGAERMRIDSTGNALFARAVRATITTDNDLSFDMNAASNFKCTPTAGGALTFTNITSGQTGNIILVNGSNYAITAAATTKVSATCLATISATGTYWLSYYSDGTNVYVANTGALA